MNRKLTGLARQYQAALRKHLEPGPPASLQPAQGLGRRAMTLGLETIDVARIHERALIELVSPADSPVTRDAIIRRAGNFFAGAITPIEKLHLTTLETNAQRDHLRHTLRQRNLDLAASNQELKQEIAQRKSVEKALRKSEQHYRRLLEQSRCMQEQLRFLSRQLLSAQEEERKKISRDLHDVIAQTLTGINVRLATLKRDAALNTKGLARNIARTQQLVVHSVKIVHRFARQLRPAVLDDLGLVPALHTLVKHFREETGIRVTLSAVVAAAPVNTEKRTVLYRVAQEALNNIARHAKTSRADVELRQLDDVLCMTIKDDGRGFQSERVLHRKRKNRLGLLGMRERVEMVKGRFAVQSAPGKGTTVLVQIPLAEARSGAKGLCESLPRTTV